jgi:hypothetical protein
MKVYDELCKKKLLQTDGPKVAKENIVTKLQFKEIKSNKGS